MQSLGVGTSAIHTQKYRITRTQITDLKQGIASFYDESSGLWEDMWGEHMHHGEADDTIRASSLRAGRGPH